jgi:hypothetical protein
MPRHASPHLSGIFRVRPVENEELGGIECTEDKSYRCMARKGDREASIELSLSREVIDRWLHRSVPKQKGIEADRSTRHRSIHRFLSSGFLFGFLWRWWPAGEYTYGAYVAWPLMSPAVTSDRSIQRPSRTGHPIRQIIIRSDQISPMHP